MLKDLMQNYDYYTIPEGMEDIMGSWGLSQVGSGLNNNSDTAGLQS